MPSSSDALATRPFFAIISSLTRFISTSSFSISTRTERPTGLTPGFADAACAGFLAADGAGFFSVESCAGASFLCSSFDASAGALSSSVLRGSLISVSTASLISDTFFMISSILEASSSVTNTMLKSKSNFSSSMSCTEGIDLITSPCPSRFLNTRNALAALRIQLGSTYTWILHTCIPFLRASLTAFFSKSASDTSVIVSSVPPSGLASSCGFSSLGCAFS